MNEEESSREQGLATDDREKAETENTAEDIMPAETDPSNENRFLNNLKAGFDGLLPTAPPQRTDHTAFSACVTVNFIDPTTGGSVSSTQIKRNLLGPLTPATTAKASSKDPSAPRDLYQKLTSLFEKEYGSALTTVPFQHVRSGAQGIVDTLPIKCVLTGSSQGGAGVDASVPWGGTGGSPVSDPAEWHHGPYCHVYIATCESLEHYRSRVKPALQAFVSQIQGAAGPSLPSIPGTDIGKSGIEGGGNYSAHYVIVYVPTATSASSSTSTPSEVTTTRMGFSERVKKVRESMQATVSDTDTATVLDDDASEASGATLSSAMSVNTRNEREIYRKFTTDFPSGRTCILATLLEEEASPSTIPQKNQEWNAFLRMLGSAVVSGFRDRVRRYNEELRRLDSRRAAGNGGLSFSLSGLDKAPFDLSHFFLVKESLAFTYEQMQLPEEALLQYEELAAFVPEASWTLETEDAVDVLDGLTSGKGRKTKKPPTASTFFDMGNLAIGGDTVGFRRRIRSTTDMTSIAPLLTQYLYARETALLFQMEHPVEVLRRTQKYIRTRHMAGMAGVPCAEGEDHGIQGNRRIAMAEAWVLSTAWDVKCACSDYLALMGRATTKKTSAENASYETNRSDDVAGAPVSAPLNKESTRQVLRRRDLARELSELIEFARLRLLNLGDMAFSDENPIRTLSMYRPIDSLKEWLPWDKLDRTGTINGKRDETESNSSESSRIEIDYRLTSPWLLEAFKNPGAFEKKYLEFSTALSKLYRYGGRHRLAARLDGEKGELLMRRGNYKDAAETLIPIVDTCANDRWDQAQFWFLFRLACCQRVLGDAAAYLHTLVQCFGPRLSAIAPITTAEFLIDDLGAVVKDSAVAKFRIGVSPFLETDLSVNPTSSGKSGASLGFLRKKITKHFSPVGEPIKMSLIITNHFSHTINGGSLKLFVVTAKSFEAIHKRDGIVRESETFRVLSREKEVKLLPGKNVFDFAWTPMTVGSYVFSTVEIRWENARFFYESTDLRKPVQGIDVLPSEPTQTIELNPLFLIPGHKQQVRVTFQSNSDVITYGSVELICSEGLQVQQPGTGSAAPHEWLNSCTVPLKPCAVGETQVLTTLVKSLLLGCSDEDEPGGAYLVKTKTLEARVTTLYRHELYNVVVAQSDEPEAPAMQTTLEAMLTTLDRPALSVDGSGAFCMKEGQVMINVSVICNTPLPFYLKEWHIEVPLPLAVVDDSDLNSGLFGLAISEGEHLFFGFKCLLKKNAEGCDLSLPVSPTLHVVLNDEFGKTFRQVLPLDLDSFFEEMRAEEEIAKLNSITAELRCSAETGLVGEPVLFTYHVDSGPVGKSAGKIFYTIESTDTDWIIAGRVHGALAPKDGEKCDVDFIGIPTRSGILDNFPLISLEYQAPDAAGLLSANNDLSRPLPPIKVKVRAPEKFKCLSYTNYMAIACPAELET